MTLVTPDFIKETTSLVNSQPSPILTPLSIKPFPFSMTSLKSSGAVNVPSLLIASINCFCMCIIIPFAIEYKG